jgi:hypothetical protein
MLKADRWAANAYRVLRLSADASAAEVHKAASAMRRTMSLGLDELSEADLPILGPCARTEATIRTAVGQLSNPADRLAHRLFWLRSRPGATADPQGIATARHDECLARLFGLTAVDDEAFDPSDWKAALESWHRCLQGDDYWASSLALELNGSFEPAARSSEVDELRRNATKFAAEPFVSLARSASARGDRRALSGALNALGELEETGDWAAASQSELGSPIAEEFAARCRTIQGELSEKIVRENAAAAKNKTSCDAALKQFQNSIDPQLSDLATLFYNSPQLSAVCKESAAQCLSTIGMAYTWADQFVTSEQLYKRALGLAGDTISALSIEQALENVKANAHYQRVRGKPINSAPSLSTINGIGFRLYGQSDIDRETGSYAANHYFTVLYIPIFPVGRYRVISAGGNSYNFLGKLPFRIYEKWHLGLALAGVAGLILYGVVSGQSQTGSSNTPVASAPYTTDAPSQAADTSASPTTTAAPVAAADATDRDSIKAKIDAGRARISELETALSPVVAKIRALNQQMDPIKAEIDSLDSEKASGQDVDVDHYNSLVDQFNSLLTQKRALMAGSKSQLDEYNSLLDADKQLVAQYNAAGG